MERANLEPITDLHPAEEGSLEFYKAQHIWHQLAEVEALQETVAPVAPVVPVVLKTAQTLHVEQVGRQVLVDHPEETEAQE